jgi:mannose-1-phosphate guanylyltransferase
MWAQLAEIGAAIGREDYTAVLHAIYPQLASLHFDDAIARHVPRDKARVLHGQMGWSDPGTLYALKEAINADPQANVTKGLVLDHGSQDCLLYNYEGGKLLAAVGLQGMVVVNTEDAILVVHKDQIPLVKELVDGLEGTKLENYS